jgi:hypothetical protein
MFFIYKIILIHTPRWYNLFYLKKMLHITQYLLLIASFLILSRENFLERIYVLIMSFPSFLSASCACYSQILITNMLPELLSINSVLWLFNFTWLLWNIWHCWLQSPFWNPFFTWPLFFTTLCFPHTALAFSL